MTQFLRISLFVVATWLVSCAGGTAGNTPPSPPTTSNPSLPSLTAGFTALPLTTRPEQFSHGHFCPPYLDYGSPSREIDFLCRTGFAIGHDPEARTPRWVIERLRVGTLNGGVERTDDFRADPDLRPGRRAELSDYAGSGYDRGHMAAAGNVTWSLQAMVESFYLSNIAPQNPGLNRGAWARLEEDVRQWTLERGDLVVITGPVFGSQSAVIGQSPVRVPIAFYKVIFDPFRREGVGYVYPNAPPVSNNRADYQVPIEQIERTTGLALISTR
ncbi:MAG: DNA/RNA non-specific endonuclease [Gammaproteobacteria bacterium]|nr:DNA/RNA non-specific endonuclease [Gammaproteobacteria bacterium]MBM4217376.1 DNA/RNA non-specific endonuclease [Gammaproteobacteria bacterium]